MKQRHHMQTVLGFMTMVTLILVVLVYYSVKKRFYDPQAMLGFHSLDDVFKNGGIDRFLEKKNQLKQEVARELNRTPMLNYEATNIAVYLFPELLSEDDLEKQIATDQWASFQRAIEGQPQTSNSRIWFEELRANIWNYENISLSQPRLSSTAQQVIRIYGAMSSR